MTVQNHSRDFQYRKKPKLLVNNGPVPEQDEITGSVDALVYRNEETGYMVCNLKVAG